MLHRVGPPASSSATSVADRRAQTRLLRRAPGLCGRQRLLRAARARGGVRCVRARRGDVKPCSALCTDQDLCRATGSFWLNPPLPRDASGGWWDLPPEPLFDVDPAW